MNRSAIILLSLGGLYACSSLTADIALNIALSYDDGDTWKSGYASGFPENRLASKETIDATTVGGTLVNNVEAYRWQIQLAHELTGDLSLKAEYDITPDTLVRLEFQIYPLGHPETLNAIKVEGITKSYEYDDIGNTLTWEGRPIEITPSKSVSEIGEYRLGVYLSYLGNSEDHPFGKVDLGKSLLQTNVSMEDINVAMHPSSEFLKGTAFCADAVDGTNAEFSIFATRLASLLTAEGVEPPQYGGYVNGFMPESNYTFSYREVPEDEVKLTAMPETTPGDNDVFEYKVGVTYDLAGDYDIQIGQFGTLPYGGIANEDGSKEKVWFGRYWYEPDQYGNWLYQEGMQWVYAPVETSSDLIIFYLLGGGWLQSSVGLWPWTYLDVPQAWAYWDFQRQIFWILQNGIYSQYVNGPGGWSEQE